MVLPLGLCCFCWLFPFFSLHLKTYSTLFYFNGRDTVRKAKRPEHCAALTYGVFGDWSWDLGTLGIKAFFLFLRLHIHYAISPTRTYILFKN